jgi:sec-independent protein translocase protein TatB
MFNVGGPEVLVILLVALIALGPAQLPKAARQVGQVMNEIRKVSTGFQRELSNAFDMEEKKEKGQSPGGPRERTPSAVTEDSTPTPELSEAVATVEPIDDEPTLPADVDHDTA